MPICAFFQIKLQVWYISDTDKDLESFYSRLITKYEDTHGVHKDEEAVDNADPGQKKTALFYKIPLAENWEEFELLESSLRNPDYNNRMMEELSLFEKKSLPSSLSSMLNKLASESLLRQFRVTGSFKKKRIRKSLILQRHFKHTLCYEVVASNMSNLYPAWKIY